MSVFLIPDALAGERVDAAAARVTGHSRSRILDLIESGGVILRTPAGSINIYGRDTQGVILMRVEAGSRLIAVQRVEGDLEEE